LIFCLYILQWIHFRRLYSAIKQSGVHTRKSGLDRDTYKELIYRHIASSEPNGATMEEFIQVLPAFDRAKVQSLLRILVSEDRKEVRGIK